jgi:hypothetical protein
MITAFELYFQSSGLKEMSLPNIIAALTKKTVAVIETPENQNRITENEAELELSSVGAPSERGSFVEVKVTRLRSLMEFISNPVLDETRSSPDIEETVDAHRITMTDNSVLNPAHDASLYASEYYNTHKISFAKDSVLNTNRKSIRFADTSGTHNISFANDSVLNSAHRPTNDPDTSRRDSVNRISFATSESVQNPTQDSSSSSDPRDSVNKINIHKP